MNVLLARPQAVAGVRIASARYTCIFLIRLRRLKFNRFAMTSDVAGTRVGYSL